MSFVLALHGASLLASGRGLRAVPPPDAPLSGPVAIGILVALVVGGGLAIVSVWRLRPRALVRLVPQLAQASALLQARVWATFVLVATIVGAVPVLRTRHDSTLGYAVRSLAPTDQFDSWSPMFEAVRSLVTDPTAPVYDSVWAAYRKFQYPLMSILPVDPLVRFFGLDTDQFTLVLNLGSWFAFFVLGALTAVLWARLQSPRGTAFWEAVPPRSLIVLVPAGIVGAMLFYPISRGLNLGQIQTTLTLLVCVALLAWQTGNKVVVGVVLALCCIVKPQWALIALWALLRREWRVVIAGAITAGAAFLLSIVVYGPKQVFSYVDVLMNLGASGETFYANQSVNGFLNRLLSNGDSLAFSHTAVGPSNPIVAAGTVVSVVVILGLALVWRVRSSPTVLELSIAILSLTIAAPVAWEHHYGVAYPVFAVLLVAQFRTGSPGRPTIVLTGAAYMLLSQSLFPIANLLPRSPLNVVQSYMLLGGLLLLALLYVQSWRDASSAQALRRGGMIPEPTATSSA